MEHIPKFVWLPIAALIWSLFVLVIILDVRLPLAKSVKVETPDVGLAVQFTATQMKLASLTIGQTIQLIDDLTTSWTLESSHPVDMQAEYSISQKQMAEKFSNTLILLQSQKQKLELINNELQQLQKNLPST